VGRNPASDLGTSPQNEGEAIGWDTSENPFLIRSSRSNERTNWVPAVKILVLDDHALFRAGLRMLLRTIDPNAECLEAADLAMARTLLIENPDTQICLLDLALKGESGFDAIRIVKDLVPATMIVVVSGTEEIATIRECINAGAMSYIPKSAPPETLSRGLRHALAGEVYLPEHLVGAMEAPVRGPSLTPRQHEVLRALSRGLPTKLIARELSISEYTVKEHIATIFEVLGARNRTDAVIRALSLGLCGTATPTAP
jgi:DNA-binding NarL/FixJ family response regulator